MLLGEVGSSSKGHLGIQKRDKSQESGKKVEHGSTCLSVFLLLKLRQEAHCKSEASVGYAVKASLGYMVRELSLK